MDKFIFIIFTWSIMGSTKFIVISCRDLWFVNEMYNSISSSWPWNIFWLNVYELFRFWKLGFSPLITYGEFRVLSYIMRFFQWCASKSGALIQFHPTFCIKFNFWMPQKNCEKIWAFNFIFVFVVKCCHKIELKYLLTI